jgi:hypothetical protein
VAISVQYYLLPRENIAVDKQYSAPRPEAMTSAQESKKIFLAQFAIDEWWRIQGIWRLGRPRVCELLN